MTIPARLLSAWCLALCLPLGCGLGGGGGDLQTDSFPQSGLGPYRLYTTEELPRLEAPYLLLPPSAEVAEVAALVGAGDPVEGGPSDDKRDRLRLWVAARPRTGGGYIGYAEAARLEDSAGDELSPALTAALPFEGGRLGSPSVLPAAGLLPGRPGLLLFYLGGEGKDAAVGVARSEDGRAFLRENPRPLLSAAALGEGDALGIAGVAALPVTITGAGELHLYLLTGGGTSLARARAPLAALAAFLAGGPPPPFRIERMPLVAADFPVAISTTESAPAERLLALSGRRVETPAGRPRYDLFVVAARDDGRRAVGAASSYDGERFLPVQTPLLGRTSGQILGATAVEYRSRALLLLGLTGSRGSVAGGRIP